MPRGADSWHQGSCDGSSCRAGRVTDKNGERVSPPPGLCKAEPATTATCGSLPAVLTPALLSLCHCHHIRSVHSSSWWGGGRSKAGSVQSSPSLGTGTRAGACWNVREGCPQEHGPQVGALPAGWSEGSAPAVVRGKASWDSNAAAVNVRTPGHLQVCTLPRSSPWGPRMVP